MADITDQHDQTSPTELDDPHTVGNGNATESRGIKRQRAAAADDDDDDDEKGGRERRKIEIKFINDKSRRHITFSKRKAGIMKKVSTPRRAASVVASCHRRIITIVAAVQADTNPTTCLRVVRLDRHSGSSARCIGDGLGLHLHDPQAAAARHQG
jgi:SRF-type transcription factor (DNA-binding and dimerisation domain)